MSMILETSKQLINIDHYYIEKKKSHGNSVFRFIRNKQELDSLERQGYVLESQTKDQVDSEKIIRILKTSWKPMTWRDQNVILSKAVKQTTKPDGSISSEIDGILFRDYKLKMCLKRWDVKSAEGENLEVTDGLIDNMHPTIAQELLNAFERVMEPEDEI